MTSLNSLEFSRHRCSKNLPERRYGESSIVICLLDFGLKFVLFLHCGNFLSFLTAAPIYEMEKRCNIEIAAQISRVSSTQNGIWVLSAYEFLLSFFYFFNSLSLMYAICFFWCKILLNWQLCQPKMSTCTSFSFGLSMKMRRNCHLLISRN